MFSILAMSSNQIRKLNSWTGLKLEVDIIALTTKKDLWLNLWPNIPRHVTAQLGNLINRAEALKGKPYECLSGSVYGG